MLLFLIGKKHGYFPIRYKKLKLAIKDKKSLYKNENRYIK